MRNKILAASVAAGLVAGVMTLAPDGAAQAQGQAPITPKTQAPQEARALARSFTAVAKALRPSVVRIDVEGEAPKAARRDGRRGGAPQNVPPELREWFRNWGFGDGDGPFDGPGGPGRGTGSGVVIDSAGNIITNAHVAREGSKVKVTFVDGREFPATIVGRDEETDVAIVRLEKPPAGLVAARLGDAAKLEVGEFVLAIGSPLGLDQTVTFGIVSGKGKTHGMMRMSGQKVTEYIQTDAKINPGNSGGPLVNLEGEVVGINTLINVGAGGAYGFAIPINQAKRVSDSLIKEGRMRYAYLGVGLVGVREISDDARGKMKLPAVLPEKGAVVTEVRPGTPAAKSGFRVGDVITKIDNQPIESSSDVIAYIAAQPVGNAVSVTVTRDGKATTSRVTLAEFRRDEEVAQAAVQQDDKIGVGLQALTPEVAGLLGLDPNTKGAVVTEVAPGSRAARAGLREEDVLIEVNGKAVSDAATASAAIRDGVKADMKVKIRRGGRTQILALPAR